MNTICFQNGIVSHIIKSETASRMGTRYNTACGTYGYVAKAYDSPVSCPSCLAKVASR